MCITNFGFCLNKRLNSIEHTPSRPALVNSLRFVESFLDYLYCKVYARYYKIVGWNNLSIPKLQRCSRWIQRMDKYFHPTFYWAYDYLSMLVKCYIFQNTGRDVIPSRTIVIQTLYGCFYFLGIGGKISCMVKSFYENYNILEDYTDITFYPRLNSLNPSDII